MNNRSLKRLKAKVMGSTHPQPLTTQANFIMREILKHPESIITMTAKIALAEGREIENLQNLAFQIMDHPIKGYVLFSPELDAWILDVDAQLKQQ